MAAYSLKTFRLFYLSYLKIISLTDKNFPSPKIFFLFSHFFSLLPKRVKKILFVREVDPLPPPKKYCYFFVGVGELKQKNFFGGESEKNFTCISLFHFRHLKMIFFCRSEK